MAYHHGPGLVQLAIKKLKSRDPVVLVKNFKHPSYRFASRNYLWEFVAMLEVDRQHRLFFRDVNTQTLPPFITVSAQKKVNLPQLIKDLKLNAAEIQFLNPHFMKGVWSGKDKIPAHYPIRLSGITLEEYRKSSYSQ